MLKKLAVEFFGTYLLVIAATGVIISQDVPFIGIAASPAVAVMIMILALGHFSDVHLNPAVSLAFLLLKKISLKTFIAYVGWQLVGGAFGALTLKAIYTQKVAAEVKNGIPAMSPQATYLTGFALELVMTAILVLVILLMTQDKANKNAAAKYDNSCFQTLNICPKNDAPKPKNTKIVVVPSAKNTLAKISLRCVPDGISLEFLNSFMLIPAR